MMIGVDTFFKKFGCPDRAYIFDKVRKYMWRAAEALGLRGGESEIQLAKTALSMVFVDTIVRQTSIREHGLLVAGVG
jgi:hypothetical protein